MGKKTGLEKNFRKNHFKKLKNFIQKIDGLTHSDRLKYFKNIGTVEIQYLNEIIYNFLNKRIKVNQKHFELYNHLKRLRSDLRKFVDKTISNKVKKQILISIKGLAIINFLLPIVKETFDF